MSEYIIMTDSTVDLPKEYLTEELGVPYIPLTYLIDGQSYEDMIGLTGEEFFAKVRAGSMPTTSQINPEQAREALEPYLKEGKDILYIAFSSGLSGTYNSIRMAAEELQEEYPERKLIVIDSLCACMGEGLLVYKAVQMKRAGRVWKKWLPGWRRTSFTSCTTLRLMIYSIYIEAEEYQRLLLLLER